MWVSAATLSERSEAALVCSLRLFVAASAIARIARALQRLSRGSAQLQIALSAREAGRLSHRLSTDFGGGYFSTSGTDCARGRNRCGFGSRWNSDSPT